MKILMTVLSACVFGLTLGCQSPAQVRESQHQIETEIISEPPGARIEVNGDYIGDTPLTTRIQHHPGDGVVMGTVVIKASPREAGQFTQTKVYSGPQFPFDSRRDKVPKTVFFDMNLRPASASASPNITIQQEINVNNSNSVVTP